MPKPLLPGDKPMRLPHSAHRPGTHGLHPATAGGGRSLAETTAGRYQARHDLRLRPRLLLVQPSDAALVAETRQRLICIAQPMSLGVP